MQLSLKFLLLPCLLQHPPLSLNRRSGLKGFLCLCTRDRLSEWAYAVYVPHLFHGSSSETLGFSTRLTAHESLPPVGMIMAATYVLQLVPIGSVTIPVPLFSDNRGKPVIAVLRPRSRRR